MYNSKIKIEYILGFFNSTHFTINTPKFILNLMGNLNPQNLVDTTKRITYYVVEKIV